MNISEAIKNLDGVIPSPDNKMVDFEHFPIAVAWKEAKAEIERLKAKNENLIVENEVLQSEKENLMRTVEEGREEIESARKETVKDFAEELKAKTMCIKEYEDGTRILQTSNKLIDQSVKIFLTNY